LASKEQGGIVPTVLWFVRLKPGITTESYEQFVQDVDYPAVKRIPSIIGYHSNRVIGPAVGDQAPEYDYIDAIEITDLESYLHDLDNHPAVEEVHSQSLEMVEIVSSVVLEIVPENA
jgi:hypothetical protein